MPLPTEYQSFIHLSRYARWNYDLKRRETWEETVDRYLNFFKEHLEEKHNFNLDNGLEADLRKAISNLDVMPSMRCLMTAGEALKNCLLYTSPSPRDPG